MPTVLGRCFPFPGTCKASRSNDLKVPVTNITTQMGCCGGLCYPRKSFLFSTRPVYLTAYSDSSNYSFHPHHACHAVQAPSGAKTSDEGSPHASRVSYFLDLLASQTLSVLILSDQSRSHSYAVVSFFSYRYYKSYEYYILAETAYEAITLSAFLMLLMELVSMGTIDLQIKSVLAEKDKMKFPYVSLLFNSSFLFRFSFANYRNCRFPFGFWRFRASKPYFWHALSFSVMQYVVLRPLISIIGIICEYYGVVSNLARPVRPLPIYV